MAIRQVRLSERPLAAVLVSGLGLLVFGVFSPDRPVWRESAAAAAIVGGLCITAAMVIPSRSKVSVPSPPSLPPFRPLRWWILLLGLVVIGASGWLATSWLLAEAEKAQPEQRPAVRIEAIRTGLSVGAGAGGGIALLLAARRQWLGERTQIHQEHDASEKQITELYVKAADQLGSERAPVRLAGLHALERLANDHPKHRQTIVDVICAYLRMPYVPTDRSDGIADGLTPQDERQVRLAAQRILTRHLQYTQTDVNGLSQLNEQFWSNISIDLSEALLIDFNLAGGRVGDATFAGAIFLGETLFDRVTFTWEAWFDRARFEGDVGFGGATFDRFAAFDEAVFEKSASFVDVQFERAVQFDGATFAGDVLFSRAVFAGVSRFIGVATRGKVEFNGANFTGRTWFTAARLDGLVDFSDAHFGDRAIFDDANFRSALFVRVDFRGEVMFDGAVFGDGDVSLVDATARQSNHHCWPEGWMLDPTPLAWEADRAAHFLVKIGDGATVAGQVEGVQRESGLPPRR